MSYYFCTFFLNIFLILLPSSSKVVILNQQYTSELFKCVDSQAHPWTLGFSVCRGRETYRLGPAWPEKRKPISSWSSLSVYNLPCTWLRDLHGLSHWRLTINLLLDAIIILIPQRRKGDIKRFRRVPKITHFASSEVWFSSLELWLKNLRYCTWPPWSKTYLRSFWGLHP